MRRSETNHGRTRHHPDMAFRDEVAEIEGDVIRVAGRRWEADGKGTDYSLAVHRDMPIFPGLTPSLEGTLESVTVQPLNCRVMPRSRTS
jgi:hypothetical protein